MYGDFILLEDDRSDPVKAQKLALGETAEALRGGFGGVSAEVAMAAAGLALVRSMDDCLLTHKLADAFSAAVDAEEADNATSQAGSTLVRENGRDSYEERTGRDAKASQIAARCVA